jgi:hypothetical protein
MIGLASYRVEFCVIGLDPLRYAGARLADRWAAWRVTIGVVVVLVGLLL